MIISISFQFLRETPVKKEIDEEAEEPVQMTNPKDERFPDTSAEVEREEEARRNPKKRPRRMVRGVTRRRTSREGLVERQSALAHALRELAAEMRASACRREGDTYDIFGKYIASLLRDMPPQEAMSLQSRVVSVIVEARVGSRDLAQVSQSDENL